MDWYCDSCSRINFSNRTECFSCHTTKSENSMLVGRNESASNNANKRRSQYGLEEDQYGASYKQSKTNAYSSQKQYLAQKPEIIVISDSEDDSPPPSGKRANSKQRPADHFAEGSMSAEDHMRRFQHQTGSLKEYQPVSVNEE